MKGVQDGISRHRKRRLLRDQRVERIEPGRPHGLRGDFQPDSLRAKRRRTGLAASQTSRREVEKELEEEYVPLPVYIPVRCKY